MSSSAADRTVDRVPVAIQRASQRTSPAPPSRVDASGAGLVLIVLVALGVAGGWWIGARFGIAISGAIMGGVLALPAAFTGVYIRYKSI